MSPTNTNPAFSILAIRRDAFSSCGSPGTQKRTDERIRLARDPEGVALAGRAARAETTVTLDEALLQSYAGEYQRNEKRTYTITSEGTRMFIVIPRGDRSEMFASTKGDFFFKVPTTTRVRFVREGASVTGLELDIGESEPVRAKKIR